MKKLLFILVTIAFLASCTTQKGYNYKAHNKHNNKLKHKAEHNNLPKCKRH